MRDCFESARSERGSLHDRESNRDSVMTESGRIAECKRSGAGFSSAGSAGEPVCFNMVSLGDRSVEETDPTAFRDNFLGMAWLGVLASDVSNCVARMVVCSVGWLCVYFACVGSCG